MYETHQLEIMDIIDKVMNLFKILTMYPGQARWSKTHPKYIV